MKKKTLEQIENKLKEIKPLLQEQYKVTEIGVFGSWVRGEQKRKSDLDILIEFEEDSQLGLLEFIHIENFLSDLLGVKVDLVEKSVLKPAISNYILQEVVYL